MFISIRNLHTKNQPAVLQPTKCVSSKQKDGHFVLKNSFATKIRTLNSPLLQGHSKCHEILYVKLIANLSDEKHICWIFQYQTFVFK